MAKKRKCEEVESWDRKKIQAVIFMNVTTSIKMSGESMKIC
jgi:hypothetical protein